MLSENSYYNTRTISLALLYCLLIKGQNENTEERMDLLRLKANECGYKERDGRLKEQFMKSINDEKLIWK